MKSPLSVHFPGASDEIAALLDPQLDGVEVRYGSELPEPAAYRVLVAGRPTEEQLRASSDLRVLLIPFAGLPKSTVEILAGFPDLVVHNLHHNAAPTAEMAMALLLSAAKEVLPLDRRLREGDWRPRYESKAGVLLEGKTALIIGYGAIGQRVATACRSFGIEVVAVSRRGEGEPPPGGELHSIEGVGALWSRADFMVVCLPLTPRTEGLIGHAELAALPEHAVIVNIGRAPIIDELALYEALRDRTIGAAGLDVWYRYPENEAARSETAPSAYPFHELDNVVMSPHRGGHTEAMEVLRTRYLAASLNQYATSATMPWPVDLDQGY